MIYAKTMQHFMAVENDKKSDNYLKWTDWKPKAFDNIRQL
jgi:hypothetical protein